MLRLWGKFLEKLCLQSRIFRAEVISQKYYEHPFKEIKSYFVILHSFVEVILSRVQSNAILVELKIRHLMVNDSSDRCWYRGKYMHYQETVNEVSEEREDDAQGACQSWLLRSNRNKWPLSGIKVSYGRIHRRYSSSWVQFEWSFYF